ncbi:hypothetical protein GOV12_00730 [Candidatus Pacearchaeota archaeon]|nr:hypothetical protein [Candidatus Pacearchaeota archaeon]
MIRYPVTTKGVEVYFYQERGLYDASLDFPVLRFGVQIAIEGKVFSNIFFNKNPDIHKDRMISSLYGFGIGSFLSSLGVIDVKLIFDQRCDLGTCLDEFESEVSFLMQGFSRSFLRGFNKADKSRV